MISRFISTLESRGGRHGETKSHDEKKDSGEEAFESEAFDSFEGIKASGNYRSEASDQCQERPSQPSNQQTPQEFEQETRESLMEETPVPSKAKAVQAIGSMFNDPRITNVLMLVLVLIGMGGAEAVQSQVCSL